MNCDTVSVEECFNPNAKTDKTRKNIKKALKERLSTVYNITDPSVTNSILKIQGFDTARYDYVSQVENFMLGQLNNDSIDNNANKASNSIARIISEADNVMHKTIGHDMLYRQLKNNVGQDEATRISAMMYDYTLPINDATKILLPYCYSISGIDLVLSGREGTLKCSPAKHLHSYVSMLAGTVHVLSSNALAGAVAVGSFFFDSARVLLTDGFDLDKIKNDHVSRKYIENMFQQFIYDVNDCSRSTYESPFTNVSVFDRVKLKAMLYDLEWYYEETGYSLDYVMEVILELQNIFCDIIDRGCTETNEPFTFPVVTINIAKRDGKIVDTEFVHDMCQRPIHRYNILVSAGSKVSSCCFDGDQKVILNTPEGIVFDKFKNIFSKCSSYDINSSAKILHNGTWSHFKRVVVPYNKSYYKITTKNNKTIIVTEDHLNPTLRGDIASKDLTTDDYLMFNLRALFGKTTNTVRTSPELSYEDGFAVGLFLGDGCYMKYKLKDDSVVYSGANYSLNSNCFDACKKYIDKFAENRGGSTRMGTIQNNTVPLIATGKDIASFIKVWVSGESASSKKLNLNCLLESVDFRKGILDGWYASDGGNSNRCYSISKELIETMEALCTSLGYITIIDKSDRTGTGMVEIRGEKFSRNYPLYCLRWYDFKGRKHYKELYKIVNNSIYFKIKSIEKVSGSKYAYCVETTKSDKDVPYFTLPNGIITHNCRLLNDTEMMDMASSVNSFGAALSLGSHRVCVVNLNRLALMSTSIDDFYAKMKDAVKDAGTILRAHKDLLLKLIKSGLQPFMANGTIDINRLFSTFGLIGTWECYRTLERKFGKNENIDIEVMFAFNDYCISRGKELGLIPNIEQIPGEAMAVRMAKADRLIFGKEAVPFNLYSNQTIPLTEKVDVFDRMKMDGRTNLLLTGGGIVHLTITERVTAKQAEMLIHKAVESGCEHFALNLFHSRCENGCILEGKYEKCPKCGAEIKDYGLRIIGFFRWSSSWSAERQEELEERYAVNVNN